MAGTKFDDSSDPAFEDALLAAAAVAAPPVAAAAAIIETGKDAVEFAGDAAGEVTGAFEDLFGGGDDVPPGTSTFPVDPNAPAPSETAEEANARGDDIRANQAHFNELGGGGGWVFNADDERHGSFGDPRQEDVSDHDVHTQADPYLELDTGIAGAGAAGANAVTAPDGAFEPVSASEPHTSVGFVPTGGDGDVGAPDGVFEPVSASQPHTGIGFIPEGADVGAPDNVFEPVSESAPHTTVGTGDPGAPDGAYEPVSESDPHTSVGADAGAPDGVFEPVSESDPHTSVGGADAGAPDGVFEPVSESDPHTSVGGADAGAPDGVFEPVSESDPHTSVGGADAGAPDGVFEPVSESDPHTSVGGADAGAPDGVFEPVAESEPHTTVGFVPAADDLPTVDGVQTEVPVGSDVQLNPQPIPPGMGADIGEPVTEAAASAGPDVADSAIIIVGGTEAAVGADLGGGGDVVSLNPQPIPPGIDLHPPGPITEAGAEVSLNPQPIPPGADIGEPVAEATAAAAPSTGDSSIIIVGGAEAPVFSEVPNVPAEAPVVVEVEVSDAPMEDVASSIAVGLDGPSFSAADSHDSPIEVSIADDSLDG